MELETMRSPSECPATSRALLSSTLRTVVYGNWLLYALNPCVPWGAVGFV